VNSITLALVSVCASEVATLWHYTNTFIIIIIIIIKLCIVNRFGTNGAAKPYRIWCSREVVSGAP